MYRFTLITITALIVLMLGVTGISAASQHALPGDSLYSVKTSLEEVQLSTSADTASKARLNMAFAQARLAEIQALANAQRYDEIGLAAENLETRLAQAARQVKEVSQQDPVTGAALSQELAVILEQQAKIFGALGSVIPGSLSPVLQTVSDQNSNDNADDNGNENENGNDNDDNGNGNENDNDDNGNDNNDDNNNNNTNDNDNDNGNDNDDNGNDNNDDNDNGNTNDNDNDNGNDNDDNGNDNNDDHDNGNTNDNDNDNDDDNDDNGNDNNDDDNNDNDDNDD